MRPSENASAFTLIELLVVIAVIAILLAILMPGLSSARQVAIAQTCMANLRTLGQGLTMYTADHDDVMVPGRLPRVDDEQWRALVPGGMKYRPTFLAIMGAHVGIQPFDDPCESRSIVDRYGEPGDKQNYASKVYVCPATANWTDERNGSYGYNYQFLGNSRLHSTSDLTSFKNWPVSITRVRDSSRTVAVSDSMGTAATMAAHERTPYRNNPAGLSNFGNEGFNLDPPRIDVANGEAAGFPDHRTSVDPRHRGRATVLYVDTHCDAQTPETLGYKIETDGRFSFEGDNSLWSGSGRDIGWRPGEEL